MKAAYSEDELLALSGIQHYAFCPRQWALIHVEQQWAENERTVSGQNVHDRCHNGLIRERRGDLIVVRGLNVVSWSLGFSGVCDVVEFRCSAEGAHLSGEAGCYQPIPVEYKRGKRKIGQEDRAQVCAQAMALEEMFCCHVSSGFIYYSQERHREEVQFDEQIRLEVIAMADEMHKLFARGYTPKARKKRHCASCSLVDVCIPDLERVASVQHYVNKTIEGLRNEEIAQYSIRDDGRCVSGS